MNTKPATEYQARNDDVDDIKRDGGDVEVHDVVKTDRFGTAVEQSDEEKALVKKLDRRISGSASRCTADRSAHGLGVLLSQLP